jgi:hypothetical protein
MSRVGTACADTPKKEEYGLVPGVTHRHVLMPIAYLGHATPLLLTSVGNLVRASPIQSARTKP